MHTIAGTAAQLSPKILTAAGLYRRKVFIEKLGWRLPACGDAEADQFDRPDTVYVIGCNPSGAICGFARLLPTHRPYLLGDVFPKLMGARALPCSPHVWELSRFAASFPPSRRVSVGAVDRATWCLFTAAVRTAFSCGATQLITVSPLGVERLLQRMGVHAYRAAPPQLIDGKPTIACWIEIDQQTKIALLPTPFAAWNPERVGGQM